MGGGSKKDWIGRKMTKIDNIFTIMEARFLTVEELQTQKEKKKLEINTMVLNCNWRYLRELMILYQRTYI